MPDEKLNGSVYETAMVSDEHFDFSPIEASSETEGTTPSTSSRIYYDEEDDIFIIVDDEPGFEEDAQPIDESINLPDSEYSYVYEDIEAFSFSMEVLEEMYVDIAITGWE